MTDTTTDYWSITPAGGSAVSLQTLRWGIAEPYGSLDAPPSLRSEPQVVPYRAGQLWQARVPEARGITFPMWIDSCTDAGTNRSASQLETNYRLLRALFWGAPGSQLTLTKRWNSGASSASASAVYEGGFEDVSNFGLQVLKVAPSLRLDHPYFLGSSTTLLNAVATGTHAVTVAGDAPSENYTLRLNGPLTNPTVTLKTAGGATVSALAYSGSITNGKYLSVTLPTLSWTTDDGAGVHPGNFTRSQVPWLDLRPGIVTSIVVGGTGAGSVTLTYYPAYF